MPASIRNLPQYRALRVQETDHDYHVTAEPVGVTSAYPHCRRHPQPKAGKAQVREKATEACRDGQSGAG